MPDQACFSSARALAADPAASDDKCLEMRGLVLTAGAPHALVVSDSAYLGAPLPAALVRSVALYASPTAAGLGDQAAQPAMSALPQLRGSKATSPDSGAAAGSGPAPALKPSLAATGRASPAQPQLRGASRVPAAGLHMGSSSVAHAAAAPGLAQEGAGVRSGADAPASASAPSAGSAALAGSGHGAHAGASSAVSEAPNPGQGGTGPVPAPQAGPQHVGRHGNEVSGGVAGDPTNSLGSVRGLTVQAAGLPAVSHAERNALPAASGPAPAPAGGVLTAEAPWGALAAAPDQARARPEAPPAAGARPALQVGAYAAEGAKSSLGAPNPTEASHPGGTGPSRAAAAVRAGAAAGPTGAPAGNGRRPGVEEQPGAPAPEAGAADGPAAELNVGSYPGMEQGAP